MSFQIAKIEVGVMLDAGEHEVIVRLSDGRVIQISPDFGCVNLWSAGSFDESPRPYCEDDKFQAFYVDAEHHG